ncbi:MAG: hypothetical protein DRQ65_05585 [Gammaproteobacteria bacterium]|nr:MAG: hypothetical protein DRQ65_05585 [Gammaproteobacteria bacterium]
MKNELMTPTEAAEVLKISRRHVYTMMKRGTLEKIRIDVRTVRVRRRQVQAMVDNV